MKSVLCKMKIRTLGNDIKNPSNRTSEVELMRLC